MICEGNGEKEDWKQKDRWSHSHRFPLDSSNHEAISN